ncbi:MAG: hypothetical protein KJ601_02865 [Nanoarchaeota archaeon]|nr:hypothetical protein [Nanoarchaeota archaeon]MBU1704048.1 hypothetical protein [Nanoarchaeota archaeon]
MHPEMVIHSTLVDESYVPLVDYGSISIGDRYQVNTRMLPIYGVVEVRDIQLWSDGKVEVVLHQPALEHTVLAHTFDLIDPDTGKPFLSKID